MSQQVLTGILKISKFHKKRQNSWKFVYILSTQRKFHFNLTKFSNFLISQKMSDFHKIFNLLGHPVKILLIFHILQVF